MTTTETETSAAVRKQLAQLQADLNNQIATENTFAQTGTQGIQQAYADLGNKLQGNLGEIQQNVDTGRAGINQSYQTAQGNIGDAESTLRQLLGNQVNMGPGGFNSPLQEIQRLSAENSAGQANSIGSFNQLGTSNINAGQLAIGDAAREGAGRQADLQSQVGAEISDLNRTYLGERSSLEVQLAQVIDAERARQEQMAQQARLAALARSGGGGGSKSNDYGKGRSELMRWAIENHIPSKEVDTILKSVTAGGISGKWQDAYAYANGKAGQPTTLTRVGPTNYMHPSANVAPDLNTVNSGLDIYYGRY